eukprot:CAMPEP_0170488064 /NCGR_PEP_ID=MMETSP0208-20121228/6690_1 /TAXON_ID=197538 /ORGANISM="Strombidium inclinatum, Strain S3" /LENGTH=56 /DNA_ID=CAMNT_0010762499 /DNA_START=262 /DNA_END=432 /DNA_ORIENTATION=+
MGLLRQLPTYFNYFLILKVRNNEAEACSQSNIERQEVFRVINLIVMNSNRHVFFIM